mmetsp:Transcript_38988/g.61723  ORF Transcript_38988/g.61723 Transcript_38988/m.61723 type:complete len:204 (-) Transcript_38988:418-1029(-)
MGKPIPRAHPVQLARGTKVARKSASLRPSPSLQDAAAAVASSEATVEGGALPAADALARALSLLSLFALAAGGRRGACICFHTAPRDQESPRSARSDRPSSRGLRKDGRNASGTLGTSRTYNLPRAPRQGGTLGSENNFAAPTAYRGAQLALRRKSSGAPRSRIGYRTPCHSAGRVHLWQRQAPRQLHSLASGTVLAGIEQCR